MKKKFTSSISLFFLFASINGFSQITYTWVPSGGTGDWTVAANWSSPLPRTTPLPTDILVFNNGQNNTVTNVPIEIIAQLFVSNNTTVNLQAAVAATVLTLGGGAGSDFTVTSGSAFNINGTNALEIVLGDATNNAVALISGNVTVSNAAHRFYVGALVGSSYQFMMPSIFTQTTGFTGNVFGTTGLTNIAAFQTGSTFVSGSGGNPFGFPVGSGDSKVVFNVGSLYKHQQNIEVSLSGRNYSNIEIDAVGFSQLTQTGSFLFSADNITVTNGDWGIQLTGGITIRGNISVAAGSSLFFNPPIAPGNNIVFSGVNPQSITNFGTLAFGTNQGVVINNAGLTLNSDVTFNNLLSFVSGVITVPNPQVLTLGNFSSVAGASNNSFVDGIVKKIGNTDFVFPVGKKTADFVGYVPLEISLLVNTSVNDSYTVEYKHTSARLIGPIAIAGLDRVSARDHWNVSRVVLDGSATANVRLYWTAETTGNGSPTYITDPAEIVAAYHDGTSWNNFGPTSFGIGNGTAGSVLWPNASTFAINSSFALGTQGFANLLPIVINYVSGKKEPIGNIIDWKVTCINNSVTFNLERSSGDKNFKTITTINADAVRCLQPFSYTDNKPLQGVNYYRLKTTDAGGKVKYSSIISVLNSATGFDIVSLMPNIVTTEMRLNLTAAQKTKMNVQITDVAGRAVQKQAYTLRAGSNQFDMNVANLAAGMYSLTAVTANGDVKTVRFVKQ